MCMTCGERQYRVRKRHTRRELSSAAFRFANADGRDKNLREEDFMRVNVNRLGLVSNSFHRVSGALRDLVPSDRRGMDPPKCQ